MILSLDDILSILKTNPMQTVLDEARKQAALLNMHITGAGLKDAVTSMDYFEDQQKKNIRQTYARSNKDIMGRLHRPIDKVFRAKGGSTVYDLPQGKIQEFAGYLNEIRNGQSLRKWIQMVALPAFLIDPMGLIFMETEPKRTKIGQLQPYPTYKSTNDIFAYKPTGRKLEWVIFNVSVQTAFNFISTGTTEGNTSNVVDSDRLKAMQDSKNTWYRVIDDAQDRLIEFVNGSAVNEAIGQTLENYFGEVPALITSDIVNFNSDTFLSPDDLVVELMNDYLTDCSVFNIWKKLHAFPKQWRIRGACSSCMGHGKIQGRDCPDCETTGYQKISTPRDEIIVPMPEDGGKLPNAFAGYVTPDIEGAAMMTSEMERLFHMAFETLWGCHPQQKTGGPAGGDKSATEAVMDVQAMNERLHDFREWGQGVETFIIDLCGDVMYEGEYKGVSNNWGSRFLVEPTDAIWDKYKNARASGAPQATLDGLLRDYYESYYTNSPLDLQKALKLMRVEPFTHFTAQQVMLMTVSDMDKCSKLYFSEWVSTKQDMEIIGGKDEALRADLLAFTQVKMDAIAKEMAAAAALQQTLTETQDDGGGIKQKTALAA